MIESDKERQAPKKVEDAEPTHLARYKFAYDLIKESDVVLDVPCGSGYGTNLLSQKAMQISGVDIHAGAIEHAKELFQSENINFYEHDAEKLHEIFNDSDLFDVIVSFEGIEHVPNPPVFLKEIRKRMHPESRLIISTPRKPHGSPYHIIEFSLDEFKKVLSEEFIVSEMYGQIYTDIFNLKDRSEDPHAYKKFNFIADCYPKS